MSSASITIDIDTTRFYRAIHGLPQPPTKGLPDVTYTLGMRRFLALCEELAIPATLFVIGSDTHQPEHQELLATAHQAGHELANHTYHHRYDLRRHPPGEIAQDIIQGEEAIVAITGTKPVGFRTPGYNIDATLFGEITKRPNYLYDSSLFPCPPYWSAKAGVMSWLKLRGRPSRSMMTPAATLLAPITPYKPDHVSPWRVSRENKFSTFWEIPMALIPGVRFPLIGTSLHLLGAKGFGAIWPLVRRTYTQLFQLEFHAIDFVDSTDEGVGDLVSHQPDLKVPWETKRELYTQIFTQIGQDKTFRTLAQAVTHLK